MPCTIKLLKVAIPEMRFYDFDEYERIVEAAKHFGQRELLTVLLGGECGLRLGEMIALEQTDIDFPRNYLRVQRAEWQGKVGLPKGGRLRRVPMTKRLAEALQKNRHLRGPRVLYRDDGSAVTRHVLRNWLRKADRLFFVTPFAATWP
jgi:integrase